MSFLLVIIFDKVWLVEVEKKLIINSFVKVVSIQFRVDLQKEVKVVLKIVV